METSAQTEVKYSQPEHQQSSSQEQPEKRIGHEAARNFFLYFLVFAMLYLVAVNIGGILFQIINKYFYSAGSSHSAMLSLSSLRFHVASIIVASPIFLFLSRKLYKDSENDEVLRQSTPRRWLTYLTLLVTTLVVVGDLIGLVRGFLDGDTPLQFVLKVFVIFFIALSVLYYYLQDLKKLRVGQILHGPITRIYFIGTIILTLALIIFGLMNVGSPSDQRKVNNDSERVNDLSIVEQGINEYYRVYDSLPNSLNDINVKRAQITDPATEEMYQYTIMDDTHYELCASFDTSSKDDPYDDSRDIGSPYLHDAGNVCFRKVVYQPYVPDDLGRPNSIPVEKPVPIR